MLKTRLSIALVALIALAGALAACSSNNAKPDDSNPPPPPVDAIKSAAKAEQVVDPVDHANKRLLENDVEGAIAELRPVLAKDPANGRARYLYATCLAEKGELRGAAHEFEQTIAVTGVSGTEVPIAVAWTRLGEIRERMGEHKAALEAYLKAIDAENLAYLEKKRRSDELENGIDNGKYKSTRKVNGKDEHVQARTIGTPEPYRNVARVSLFLGEIDGAIRAIEQARAFGPRDPLTESLAVRAYQRAGDDERALEAARTFIEVAGDEAIFADRSKELKEFVRTHSAGMTANEKGTLVDYCRTALRPQMPGEDAEGSFFAAHRQDRLLARDDRAVFVTVIPEDPLAARLRARGKGRTLASAVAGAVAAIKDNKKYDPVAARRAAIRIDIEKGELEPIVLAPAEFAPLDEPLVTQLTARPPVDPGIHGVALRVDDREIFCLPGDAVTEDLPDVKAMLEFAAREAGLAPRVWEGAVGRVFRFRTDSFVSSVSGASPVELVRGEPVPFPEANPAICADAATLGALWLAQDLLIEEKPLKKPIDETLPDGTVAQVWTLTLARFHYEYEARSDKVSDASYNEVRHAGAALALARAFARTQRPELRDAAVLTARWLEERGKERDGRFLITGDDGKTRLGTQALTLALEDELAVNPPLGEKDRGPIRDALARTIVGAMREDGTFPAYLSPGGQGDGESQFFPGEAILALERHARSTGDRHWLDAATKATDARIREWRARAQEGVPPLDSWLARAIAEMDTLPELAGHEVELSSRRTFALEVANAIVAHQRGPDSGDAAGGLAPPSERFPRGMPTASLGEGLAAVAALARYHGLPEARKLRDAARAAASFALRHQYTARNSFYLPNPEHARGAFRSVLTGSKVRIDGVQHNVEMLFEVEKLLRE